MTTVRIINGDIADVKADALITAVNSTGMQFGGGVSDAIKRAAGGMYHGQIQAASPLRDGQIVYARGTGPHEGAFTDVLFTVDDLKIKLYSIVTNALRAAAYHEARTVSLPLLRTGVTADRAEPRDQAVTEIGLAVRDFVDDDTLTLDEVAIVVYHNSKDYARLLARFPA